MTHVLILLALPQDIRTQYRDRLRATFPELTVDLVDHHSKVDPYIGEAEVLITFGPMLVDRVFALSKRLKWVQALGTGVDNLIDLPSLPKNAIVTNLHGIHGAPVSEAAIASMLLLSRRMHHSVRAQDNKQWGRWPATLLNGKTVGILGVGAISETLAPRCKAFDMKVVGITSGIRQVAGFDEMRARNQRSRDRLVMGLRGHGYAVLPCPATWFVNIDLTASGIAMDDLAWCDWAIETVGVAPIPVSAFYDSDPVTNVVRLCHAKTDATLDAALERLGQRP